MSWVFMPRSARYHPEGTDQSGRAALLRFFLADGIGQGPGNPGHLVRSPEGGDDLLVEYDDFEGAPRTRCVLAATQLLAQPREVHLRHLGKRRLRWLTRLRHLSAHGTVRGQATRSGASSLAGSAGQPHDTRTSLTGAAGVLSKARISSPRSAPRLSKSPTRQGASSRVFPALRRALTR